MKQLLYKLRLFAIALLFAVTAMAAFVPRDIATARDCDSNAIMRCGAYSISELKQKYRQNQNGNVKAIYAHFGIHNESYFDGMVEGRVTGHNDVFVGNKKVATHAVTAGRHNITRNGGSTPILGGAAYKRHPSVSFKNPNGSLQAYVKLDANGNFKYAIIKSCGNPVVAKPIPQPEFKCVKLVVDRPRIEEKQKATFTATAHVKNTQVLSYDFHYSDGVVNKSSNNRDTRTFTKPGTYEAYVIIRTKAGNTKKVAPCTVKITVTKKPAPKPEFKCVSLKADKVKGTEKLTVNFTAEGYVKNTSIVDYTFNFGDGSAAKTQTSNKVSHTYTRPGAYEAYVLVNTKAGKTTKVAPCVVKITVKEKEIPKVPGLNIEKEVRVEGTEEWADDVHAAPGDTLEYRVVVSNTGEVDLNNVVVRDVLPEGVEYVTGSFQVTPSVEVGDFFRDGGVNVGTIKVGEEKVITFKVKVHAETEACEDRGLKNVAFAKAPEVDEKNDDAYALVCKEVPPEEPEQPEEPQVLPPVLPETGVGSVIGLFSATSVAGALAHRLIYGRRR